MHISNHVNVLIIQNQGEGLVTSSEYHGLEDSTAKQIQKRGTEIMYASIFRNKSNYHQPLFCRNSKQFRSTRRQIFLTKSGILVYVYLKINSMVNERPDNYVYNYIYIYTHTYIHMIISGSGLREIDFLFFIQIQ